MSKLDVITVFEKCVSCYKLHNAGGVCDCSFCDCFEEACNGITVLKEYLKGEHGE